MNRGRLIRPQPSHSAAIPLSSLEKGNMTLHFIQRLC